MAGFYASVTETLIQHPVLQCNNVKHLLTSSVAYTVHSIICMGRGEGALLSLL